MKWHGYGLSDTGKQRERNEDRFFIDNRLGIYIVADGMGGVNGGEVAAQMVIEEFSASIKDALKRIPDITNLQFQSYLQESIHAINDLIYRYGIEHDMLGMGSTVVLAILQEGSALVAHIGDSRCYCVASGSLEQITIDHASSENQYELIRVVGAQELTTADIKLIKMNPTDRLLLCSDGLNHMVSDQDISRPFRFKTSKGICRNLIDLANKAGGEDNITCIVVRNIP